MKLNKINIFAQIFNTPPTMKSSDTNVLSNLDNSSSKPILDGAISDTDGSKKTISTTQTTWLGKENTDWNCPDNWTNGIPNTFNHAFIPATTNNNNFPILTTNLSIDFTLKNEGSISIENTTEIIGDGLIQNEGTIEIINVATLINNGKFVNLGTITNYGTIINKKTIVNEGRLNNDGVIDNEDSIVNMKELFNSGFIDTDSELTGEGELVGSSQIDYHI